MSAAQSIFSIAGSAMRAQMLRLNTTASNLANADSVASSAASVYRPMRPVFGTVQYEPGVATVSVERIDQSGGSPIRRHAPDHPMADENGDIWETGIDQAAELVDMLEASRQYQNNVQVLQTAKALTLDTLRLGQ
ncbi:MAG: flagellar basal body rod protein FlgC [Sphingopyxis sp.]